MPPKRATAAPVPLFADCVFGISGSTATHTQSDILKVLVGPGSGATVPTTLTKKVTHLITNDQEVLKGSAKVQKALAQGVSLVTFDWVTDSMAQNKRLDEAPYKVSAAASAPAATAAAPTTSTDATTPAPKGVKRKAEKEEDEGDEEKETKATVEKKIKSLTVKVDKAATKGNKAIKQPRIDPYCGLNGYEVHVDSDVAWNVRLNQTEIGNNNNKFYFIQVLANQTRSSFACFARWGRVGTKGQISTEISSTLEGAQKTFESKFKDKTKNPWANRDNFTKVEGKYYLLPPDDGDSDSEDEDDDEARKEAKAAIKREKEKQHPIPESTLHPKVQDLMKLIFNQTMMANQMKELDYDADKMPLGKLAKATILRGYLVLKQIGEALSNPMPTSQAALMRLSSDFYTVIPHNFGRNAPPVISDPQTLKKKLDMLEALAEIEIAQHLIKENKKADEAMTVNPLDQKFASLKLNKLEPMDRNSERFKLIEQFTKNSHGSSHGQYGLVIDEVFDLDRDGEQDRFDSSGFSKLHNRRLLWHGSRLTNYVGILSQGLRIAPPEAPVTGYMFDKGAYFADCVSKSANYCFTTPSNNTGLMLLCEVALGDMFEIEQSDYNAKKNSEDAGKQSTKGLGLSYPDESGDVIIDNDVRIQAGKLKTQTRQGFGYRLAYNEYIVYNTSQVKMRYLIKMRFDYSRRY
ncbi:poly [ADP-ribose] polymerase 2/3/4 [Entomortierella parvispora]|uniref:Poly [ADP-ribose] polymerase n=1 Tax=Entomortierella parvispora TaxID=205924 RepID=A0A9P3LW44_9FUNG|nr:poly [ADP-ribose] polymerase 2/3/4 [Entomortierella parvispora]